MRDFDAAFAEAAGKPITFRLFDQQWSVPREVPAEAVLMAERLRMGAEDEQRALTRSETVEFARAYLGDELVDEWVRRRITIPQLQAVVNYVLQGGDDVGEDEPAGTPATDGGKSSNGGRSSKRTSNGSTASTSRKKSRVG